jgi:hypothetical protein
MCHPSANKDIELNSQPNTISMTIMDADIHMTIFVPVSADRLPASKW